jgi:NOL1/NOP2/sun family putative RNA methylase
MFELPKEFAARMQSILKDDYNAFEKSYENETRQSLRVNTLKSDVATFCRIAPFDLKPVPWLATGFYYGEQDRPGKHPYHACGLYYIQEASAMAVATFAGVEPGMRVLDLCAAPGGKSTQLAAALAGEGLLMANEIHPARAKVLSQNIERMGIANAIVTNETPEKLAKRFPAFFDVVVVDAPCSGEGMFRKEPEALTQWTSDLVTMCALRQSEILDEAQKMLKAGGRLVYSTCTFAPEEDELQIADFLSRHPHFKIASLDKREGLTDGLDLSPVQTLTETKRIWPHLAEGEGHYIAALVSREDGDAAGEVADVRLQSLMPHDVRWQLFEAFAEAVLKQVPEGHFEAFGDQLYLKPLAIDLAGIKVLRPGLHLGTVKKGRFEPSHALALALKAGDFKASRCCSYAADSPEIVKYLKGETLVMQGDKGWCIVLADMYPIGWAKRSEGILKNHYPKGLRWM